MNGDLTSSPHQAQSANGYVYAYDTHGNQSIATHGTASKTRTVTYSLDDRAYEMTKGTDVTRFWYGVGGDRYKRQDISAAGTKTTINVANLEIEKLNGVTTTKRTVAGVLLEVEVSQQIPKLFYTINKYLHYDQLGNVVRITNASGVVLEKLDFDAFGARRNVIDPRQTFISAGNVSNGTVTLPGNQILTLYATKRGFTGHEMVDGFDIVHMNGRIYDNMIGRFLQADPVVQDPSNTQNFNRYTYVWNNPLAYTDPSGYSSVGNMFRQILAIAIVIVGNILIPGSATLWQSMLLGFLSGAVTGGVKGGITGAFSAGLFFGIGTGFAKLAAAGKYAAGTLTAMKVLAHGIAGGVMSVLQGGKFGHGFASAGVTQAFADSIDTIDAGNVGFSAQRTIAAAVVGGTASVLSGGKFASGAVTGAFSRAFNDEVHKEQREQSISVSATIRKILKLEYDGEKLKLSLKIGKPFTITVNEDGSASVTQGPLVAKFDNEQDLLGSGVKWKSFTVDAMVNRDRTIDFSGKVSLPAAYKIIGDIEVKYTRHVDVDALYASDSWSVGRVNNGLQKRQERINNCIDGIGVQNGVCL